MMTKSTRIVLILVLILVALFGVWYTASRYLVSRLDGTGNPPPQTPLTERYSSEEGYTFYYPNTYELSSHPGGLEGGDTLVLQPKGYVAPENGEGGPAITIASYSNPDNLALDEWVRTDARSNWQLAEQNGGLGSTQVGGKFALAYKYSGLYENDAVAVAVGNKIFVFSVGWMNADDQMRLDFSRILDSVTFN